jgi:hypothetical protein
VLTPIPRRPPRPPVAIEGDDVDPTARLRASVLLGVPPYPEQESAAMPPATRAERTPAVPAPMQHHQNAVGDIVIPLERGEIVALPRLWDFDLASGDPDGCVLVGPDGMLATVVFTDGTAVVESVAEGSHLLPAAVR